MIVHKRGDTFEQQVVAQIAPGVPADMTIYDSYSIAAWMRHPSGAIVRLTVTITSAEDGEFTLSATAAETALWAPGIWQREIEYTLDDAVTSTDLLTIKIDGDIVNV